MTIAGELLARMAPVAAGTQAERDRVLDEMFARKIAERGAPPHGWLFFVDGSGIEMVEKDADDLLMHEVAGIFVGNN